MLIRVRLGGAPPAALITFSQPQKAHRTAHMGAKKQSLENLENFSNDFLSINKSFNETFAIPIY